MSIKHEYSEKIQVRRRSLFPNEKLEKHVELSDNLDEIHTLTSSDNEFSAHDLINDENIRLISSTKLINDILSTPRSKHELLIEDSMSPLYLSPLKDRNTIIPEISPTKFLKTPNDSNAHPDSIPKLSRKSLIDHFPSNSDSQESSSPTHSKCSKVRTSLFPEFNLSPKKFYPKNDSSSYHNISCVNSKQTARRMDRRTKKRCRKLSRKRISGQINAGVRHCIKKPKAKTAVDTKPKVTTANLAKIKTFKPEAAVSSEFNAYFKDLEELKKARDQKLIQVPLKRLHNEESGINDQPANKKLKTNLTTSESDTEQFETNISQNINEIIDFLDNSNENSAIDEVTESLLSPTSEISNMASGLKIESPKKAKNLNRVLETMTEDNHRTIQSNNKRYFPIFYPDFHPEIETAKTDVTKFEPKRKKMKVASDQMLLDAGQKKFGLTQCQECDFVYHVADPSDEKAHNEYHNGTRILQFHGWKNERVVGQFANNDRIIKILPKDPNPWISKVQQILEFVNRDMGFFDVSLDISKLKVFLYISHRTIAGCLVAENKTKGHKIITLGDSDFDMCSEEEYSIKCGVLRLWISPRYRKKGIATKLMDSLKLNFIPDNILTNSDIAISSPTDDGKLFAIKYFRTSNFLTYFD